MRILLVNDDGILAPGLAALRSAVQDLGDVAVVAPDSPQSASGRSITVHGPILCERVHVEGQFWGFGISGRPADCVKLAVRELMEAPPDLLLAGINPGANVGVNVFYSGTVAAAAEGALLGVPSVAFSVNRSDEMDFHRAGRICRWVLDALLAEGLAEGELINVNLPALKPDWPRGVRVVPQNAAPVTESYTRQSDADGRVWFHLNEYYEHATQGGESDVTALAEGFITVTPLNSDMTDADRLTPLQRRCWPRPPA